MAQLTNHIPPHNGEGSGGKAIIFGALGYLGQHFAKRYPRAIVPKIDIADAPTVRQLLAQHRPDVVINCAGRCGDPNVDWCEDHKTETLHSNVTGALVLLEECVRANAYLVHMSSGCIYTGDNGGRGFSESDPPNFAGSFYSRTKAWADQIFKEFPVLTLRLRMPFDGSMNPRNLLMKLRRYGRVLDEPNSLTCLPDFLDAAQALIAKRTVGVFNVTNPGAISPFEVMRMYQKIVDPAHEFEPLRASQMSEVTRAARSNCILDTTRLKDAGIRLPPIQDAVTNALHELARNLAGHVPTHAAILKTEG